MFTQCAAPTFFLFATAALVDLMNTRLSELNEKLRDLQNADAAAPALVKNFNDRAQLLRRGILDALIGSVFTVILLVQLFVVTFFSMPHAYGAAVIFTLAATMLGIGLIRFAQEARLALREGDL
jgi:membrane-associated HD superfamily phosphohydrolase